MSNDKMNRIDNLSLENTDIDNTDIENINNHLLVSKRKHAITLENNKNEYSNPKSIEYDKT
jgi:hypothetical protein